jgi:predicted NodU family carbamoyl transferase
MVCSNAIIGWSPRAAEEKLMPTLGINFGHDAGVALTDATGVRVIEAERRLGQRHVCGGDERFASQVRLWLAELCAQSATPVNAVAVSDWFTPRCEVLPSGLVELVDEDVTWNRPGPNLASSVRRTVDGVRWPLASVVGDIPIVAVRHHYAHCALGYFTSGAPKALVLALDGTGHFAESGMVCLGDGSALAPVLSFDNRSGPRFGLVYEAVANRIHGGRFDTGKLLGLTATGSVDSALLPVLRAMMIPVRTRQASPDLFDQLEQAGLIGSAIRYVDTWYPYDPAAGGYLDRFLADATDEDLVQSFGSVFPDAIRTANGHTVEIGRNPEDPTCRQVAATLQAAVEADLLWLVAGLAARYPDYRTLCYAGGCALNINANTRIVESGIFAKVYVPTCCDDSGIALGAALAVAGAADRPSGDGLGLRLAYAGPALDGVASAAAGRSRRVARTDDEFLTLVSELLIDQRCVAWLEGSLETGPRALGHRSLLASAHWAGARQFVSQTIKNREWFRPVAPICPVEVAAEYFEGPVDSADTMLFSVMVWDRWIERLAEVRHIDGSARLQTVDPVAQPRLHKLCHLVGQRTGLPVLINTSANRGGFPILNDLNDALALLDSTKLDAVAVPDERVVFS